jgi:dTDP-4-amino-4,6-dideoxygalactose transaminase
MKIPLNTDILSKEIITLPIYPDMSNKEILFVINNIKEFISKIKIKKTNF